MKRMLAVFVAALALSAGLSSSSDLTAPTRLCKPTIWTACPAGPTGPAQFRCYVGKQYPRAWRCGAGQGMNEPGKSGAW